MAESDIKIKVALEDTGFKQGFEKLVKVVDKFTKAADKLLKTQKSLVKTQNNVNKANKEEQKQQEKLNVATKQRLAVSKSLNAQRTKEIRSTEKAIDTARKQQIQMQQEADVERRAAIEKRKKIQLQEKERIATIKGKDARRANILQIKRENLERQKVNAALKADIIRRTQTSIVINQNTKALNRNAFSLKLVGKGLIDITNQGRLVQNSFATIRSKLLLASFGFGLVTAAVGKNIKAFAEQQESVLRLGLQFGSLAANELAEFASAQQKITRFGDEVINSVMSQFGAYGANVEQTKLLTTATLDLAEGQGMDLNSAALLVAKSFGSTTNALSRYGISIDSSSSKQEKINQIITQSQKKYGGLAKLLGKMSGSEIKQLSMAFGDLQERFGDVLQEGLEPVIKGMTRFIENLNTTQIRIMAEAILSLAGSFIFLRTVALGATMVAAVNTARKTLARFTAIQLATKGVTTGLTTSLVVFKRALVGVTGGFGALLAITATVGVALFEMSGLFKSTAKEEESAKKELDEYKDSLNTLRTDDAMEQLKNFFDKLVQGNNLLKIANASFTKELTKPLEAMPDAFSQQRGQLINQLEKTNQEILKEEEGFGSQRLILTQMVASADNLIVAASKNGNQKRVNELIERKRINIFELALLDEQKQALVNQKEEIEATLTSISIPEQFKNQFIELTGVTSDFFDEFIAGSGVMESVQSGLISTNSELVAVMNTVISKKGNFLELSETERLAIIAEIVAKQKLDKTNKEVSTNAIKFAEMEASAKAKLVGATLKSTAALLSSQGKNAKESARLQQLAAIADTYAAATKTVLNPVQMAQVIIAGLANVAQIEAALNRMGGSSSSAGGVYGKFEHGGYVGGNRHSQGGTIIEAERGEFVMSRNAVESIGLETLNQMNQSGGGGNINVNVSGNVLTQDFVEGELAESIKEAVRRGSDFGIG
tara:strand:- start:219 stop:3056 length:2838 start_codon:yes stop_codon:yes gene_type:complete